MTFDVTLLGEELVAPILTSFFISSNDVLKAVSNEQFKSVQVRDQLNQ